MPPQTIQLAKTIIVTTEDEIALFEKIKSIFEAAIQNKNITVYEPGQRRFVPPQIGYKDTSAYFGIYINKPSWWIIRASVESIHSKWSTNWIGFDLPVERVKEALPEGAKLLPPSAMAETRIIIESIDDVHKIENVILMAIDHEIQRHQASSDAE